MIEDGLKDSLYVSESVCVFVSLFRLLSRAKSAMDDVGIEMEHLWIFEEFY